MFSRQERLNRHEFTTYFKEGKRYSLPLMQVIYTPSEKLKVAVVVGKKVSKQAVVRNKLRRQTYHSLRGVFIDLKINKGVFIVILRPATKDAPLPSFKEIKMVLKEGIAKIGLAS